MKLKCPETGKYNIQMQYVHTMEYYSAIKILNCKISKEINRIGENMLNGVTQTLKCTYSFSYEDSDFSSLLHDKTN